MSVYFNIPMYLDLNTNKLIYLSYDGQMSTSYFSPWTIEKFNAKIEVT
jgi:hypothetical protein